MIRLNVKTLPVSTNRMYYGRRFLTDEARACKELIAHEARAGWRGEPLKGAVRLEIELVWGDRRRHDVDNVKALLDALQGIVYVDDSQITTLILHKSIDKKNPRVVILADNDESTL